MRCPRVVSYDQEGAILKSNMVNPGKNCKTSYTVDEIAVANLQVFRRCFPTAMVTANFLSGGQSLEDAAARLDAINKHKTARDPWNLSFSWSAAIQMPLFQLCKGKDGLQLEVGFLPCLRPLRAHKVTRLRFFFF